MRVVFQKPALSKAGTLQIVAFQGFNGPSQSSSIKVNVKVPLKVKFGQAVAITGSSPALGAWNEAVTLDWSEGDVWTGDLEMAAGEVAAYKLQIRSKHGLEWQPGEDRRLELPAQATAVEVLAAWAAPEPEVKVLEQAAAAAEAAAALAEPRVVEVEAPAALERTAPAAAAAAAAEDAPTASTTRATPEEDYGFLEDLTIKDLKDRLKNLGLSLSGRKVELIDRLREALGQE